MNRTQIRKRLNKVLRDLEEVEREVTVLDRPVLDLVGVTEAAEILGTTANAISSRRARGSLPEPIVTLSCGPIWHRGDIEALLS
jgi:hypothetical protein